MKRYVRTVAVATIMALAGTNAFAQFGVGAGYMLSNNRTRIEGVEKNVNFSTNGFYVGAYYDMNIIGEAFSVRPGLYYQHLMKVNDVKSSFPNVKMTNSYMDNFLAIPVHLKGAINIVPGILKIYVFAGPSFEIGLSASDELSVKGNTSMENLIDGKIRYNYYTQKIKTSSLNDSQAGIYDDYLPSDSRYRRFDVMLGGGVGLEIVRFIDFKVGYDYGLVNRYKGDFADTGKLNRDQFYVGLAVRF
ncbi:MAG: PorT family protein [Bacteroidales bacterium]|nr:PorT family protein [Bacteroides sp.]MCM1199261.1 PorT family protein [Clostridium sp.]MCM1501158.1 PorT family protein [Bacteroidales bacterium]